MKEAERGHTQDTRSPTGGRHINNGDREGSGIFHGLEDCARKTSENRDDVRSNDTDGIRSKLVLWMWRLRISAPLVSMEGSAALSETCVNKARRLLRGRHDRTGGGFCLRFLNTNQFLIINTRNKKIT